LHPQDFVGVTHPGSSKEINVAAESTAGPAFTNLYVGPIVQDCNEGSRPRPRPQALDLPGAVLGAAGLALHPGLLALPTQVARQEVAAGRAVLGIGAGDRGDGSARAAR